MTELCVDASVAVKWAVRGEPFRSKALVLLNDAKARSLRLIAPLHFFSEIDSVICKRLFDGRLSPTEARKAYAILDAAPVSIVDMSDVRGRARQIAEDFDLQTVYDAWYAALAEMRGCDFWTADRVFYEAVRSDLAFVHYLPDYQYDATTK